jgi:hypothetical protein
MTVMAAVIVGALQRRNGRARDSAQDDHEPGRRLPHEQKQKVRTGQRKVGRTSDAGDPDRAIERRQEQSDHRGIDPAERSLRGRAAAEVLPERHRPDDQKERRQEDADEANAGAEPAIRGRSHDGAQIGRERE